MRLQQVNHTAALRTVNGSWISMGAMYFGYRRMRDLGGFGARDVEGRSLYKLKVARFILSIFHRLEKLEVELPSAVIVASILFIFIFVRISNMSIHICRP
jgi:hypothetical protein